MMTTCAHICRLNRCRSISGNPRIALRKKRGDLLTCLDRPFLSRLSIAMQIYQNEIPIRGAERPVTARVSSSFPRDKTIEQQATSVKSVKRYAVWPPTVLRDKRVRALMGHPTRYDTL